MRRRASSALFYGRKPLFFHFFVLRSKFLHENCYFCARNMAGLYVHIPFCKSRCIYCDFYSTTREAEKEAYVTALCREIAARKQEFAHTRVRTIYIGGGTPSLLSSEQLNRILSKLHEEYDVAEDAEVTVEMNPEDIDAPRIWGGSINRVSLGIQTFDEGLLRFLRRRHSAERAVEAVRNLQQAGIRNISIDLIYGLPGQTMELWERDLDKAFELGVQHLSAYALSYEEGTPLWQMRQQGKVKETSEILSVKMFELLCKRAKEAGFLHYEISNFAQPGRESRHNSSYWTGEPYLGFGPGAHSYDGRRTRRANNADLSAYLQAEVAPATFETLTNEELYDEAVMCGLRTARGIDLCEVERRFGLQRSDYLQQMAHPHIEAGRLVVKEGWLHLSEDALMVSDDIMSDLML